MALTNPQETILTRPSCCEYSGGRVFYGAENTIYFSQVMEGVSLDKLEKCYQQNDPTSEHVSDLLDTDGGTIQVDNATDIVQIKKFGTGVLVYSLNGVWFLAGSEGGFTATNYSLTLVTEAGCISPQSVVSTTDAQYYWSREGIYGISVNQFGQAEAGILTEGVIQGTYNDIPNISKQKCVGAYNRIKKQVEWHYPSTAQDQADEYKYALDKGLIFDIRGGGFWPQEYNTTKTESVGNFIASVVNTNVGTQDYDTVLVTINLGTPSSTQNYNIDFGTKTDTTFQDFSSDYTTAYIETGYETLGKPSNKKVIPYINTHFKQTEENWIADGSGGLTLDNQSGCQMRAKWDWNSSDDNGRWSPAQQVYRFRRINVPAIAGPFNSGEQVITTKNKMLGRGESISIRFEQEPNKDMQLLGYTCTFSIKGKM